MTGGLAIAIRMILEIYETAAMWGLLALICLTCDLSEVYREIDDIYGEVTDE